MKQAEEILNRIGHTQDGTKFSFSYNEALEAMKEYAKLVAEQALENAYTNIDSKDVIEIEWSNIHKTVTSPNNIPTL